MIADVIRRIETIDAHVAGQGVRMITGGFPAPEGSTMLEKQAWLHEHNDDLRRALMREPRGHAGMSGVMLTTPCDPEALAGVLFMDADGYSTMLGHGVIAAATIALDRDLIGVMGEPVAMTLESPAGLVRVDARGPESGGQVSSVSFENVPAFVLHPAVPVPLDDREVPVDVAFGGAFYAIVDSETVGVPLRRQGIGRLREVGLRIAREVERLVTVEHPVRPGLAGVHGTIFTGPPEREDAALRNLTVFSDGQVERSPGGCGIAAVMAVLDAMQLIEVGFRLVHESLADTRLTAVVRRRVAVGELDGIMPEITGAAWITGEHTFLIDDEDPLAEGFEF